MKAVTVEMHLGKETKGTYVYTEGNDGPRSEKTFPTVYIQKHALPDPPPAVIKVTIEAVTS